MTAREAWDLAWPAARDLDASARLTLLTSGTDISPEGRSFTWSFGLELPRRGESLLLSVEPSGEAAEVDDDPLVLDQRRSPRPKADLGRRPALPLPFRDSPEAVAELAAGGVDFVSGPTDMTLSGRVEASGEAVWVTESWDGERTTPFAAEPTAS